MSSETKCPLCENNGCSIQPVPVVENGVQRRNLHYSGKCKTCGNVIIDYLFYHNAEIPKPVLFSYLRNQSISAEKAKQKHPPVISNDYELTNNVNQPKSPIEKVEMIILYLAFRQKSYNDYITFEPAYDYPICFSENESEFLHLLYYAHNSGLIESQLTEPLQWQGREIVLHDSLKLTMLGWEKADELNSKQPDSSSAFVAFLIDKDDVMKRVYEKAIKPALEDCGYKANASLVNEHNEGIVDTLLSDIRKSGLVVADVTGASHNVYYEAGFAYGLGIPVIYTCKKDQWDESKQFDTIHIKHILWNDENDLRERLIHRIEASGLSKRI